MDSRRVSTKGDVFFVLDPRHLPWGDEIIPNATRFLAEVRRSRAANPSRPVLVPGDRGRSRAILAAGNDRIRLPRRLWETLNELAVGRDPESP
jgi:LDH2 family malate/lactate/ureidoglycolate dehydrogenase